MILYINQLYISFFYYFKIDFFFSYLKINYYNLVALIQQLLKHKS